jgi:DNA-binding MarR family transcriptional regulator
MKVFLAYSATDAEAVEQIAEHLRSNGMQIVSPEDTQTNPLQETAAAILSADLCLAIIGARPERVLFEVGVAAGAGVPTLVVALPGAQVPDALSSYLYVAFRGHAAWDLHNLALRLIEMDKSDRPERSISRADEAAVLAVERNPALVEGLTEREFSRLVGMLLQRRGFEVQEVGKSPVDMLLREPAGGLTVVEVKRRGRSGLVPIEAVRTTLDYQRAVGARHALIVSDGSFTSSARAFAEETGVRLIDFNELVLAPTGREILAGLEGRKPRRSAPVPVGHRSREVPRTLQGSAGVFLGDAVDVGRMFLRLQWDLAEAFSPHLNDAHSLQLLVDLYLRSVEGARTYVSDLCLSSGMPTTTTLRYISRLEQTGALERYTDPTEPRRSVVRASPEAVAKIEAILSRFASPARAQSAAAD